MVLARDQKRRCTRSQAVYISSCWCVVHPWYLALHGKSLQAGIATGLIAVAGTRNPLAQIRAQRRMVVHWSVKNQVGV